MPFSTLRSKSLHHSRSLSFPSKIIPAAPQLDKNLSKAKVSEAASCSSLPSMKNQVSSLKNWYSHIDDFLLLPHIQQIISQEYQEKLVNQVLDGYIRLLDACTTAKDIISNMKQHVQELLSALRRRDADGICCYLDTRKKLKKNIQKSLKDFRGFRRKHIRANSENNHETVDLVHKLTDAESVTITAFESLLSCLYGTKMQARLSGWSLMTKLMHSKKVINCQGEDTHSNEFEKMDALLQMNQEDVQVEELMNLLKEIDSSVQCLEEELECLCIQLIKTRVFVGNILNR